MKRKNKFAITGLALLPFLFLLTGCPGSKDNDRIVTSDTTKPAPPADIKVPAFNADSAYYFTQTQVDFGPRIPGTKAHKKCLDFIVAELEKDSLHPMVQTSKARTFDGKQYEFNNVMISSDPKNNARILICTHWDTRPWSDMEAVDSNKPFDGADDGASGVAMLLEVARHLKGAGVGVDLVFFDLEDYGQQEGKNGETTKYPEQDNTWCLGSQYWAKNLPTNFIMPRYGILLDMVGGKDAVFPMEGTSLMYAPKVVNHIWDIASTLGYSGYFTRDRTAPTIDDHKYVNELAGIPTIDIVHYDVKTRDYPYFHHKQSDNMSVIDKKTMGVVGNLLLHVIYLEKNNSETP